MLEVRDSSHLAFLFQEGSLSSENQPHESNVTWCLSGPAAGRFWTWDISEPQTFWVSAPQPELLALPRDSLYTQTLRGWHKVSIKGHKIEAFYDHYSLPQRCFRSKCRALSLPMSLNRAPSFHQASWWVQNGPSQMWALSKCESFLSNFAFSRGSGTRHLFSCPLPPFRNIEFHAFCVSPGQRILHL